MPTGKGQSAKGELVTQGYRASRLGGVASAFALGLLLHFARRHPIHCIIPSAGLFQSRQTMRRKDDAECPDAGRGGALPLVLRWGCGNLGRMPRLVIYGCGGFGRELLTVARSEQREIVFASDEPGPPVLGVPVIHPNDFRPDDEVVIAIADGETRQRLAAKIPNAATLMAPTAIIGPGVEIGEGAIFCDYTMVTASARIGRHFHCNIYSYVTHDCIIGDFVTFGANVCCNGNVRIADGAYVGTGAVIKNGVPGKPILIGVGAVIGCGAVVTKDVPPGATLVGNPARQLERRVTQDEGDGPGGQIGRIEADQVVRPPFPVVG